jgi:hypothetical protein
MQGSTFMSALDMTTAIVGSHHSFVVTPHRMASLCGCFFAYWHDDAL